MCHKRSVASRFLLNYRLEIKRRRRLHSSAAQRIQSKYGGRNAPLHITGAASVHPAAVHDRFERWVRPHIQGPRRHNVDMALKNKRPPGLLARAMNSNNDGG